VEIHIRKLKRGRMAEVKRIQQSTFDDVVKENVEDFDMSVDEALADAINQFTSQKVDLSNVDLTGGVGREEVQDAIAAIKVPLAEMVEADCMAGLAKLTDLCSDKHQFGVRNMNLMNSDGGMNAAMELLNALVPTPVILSAATFLALVCKHNQDCRDFFEPGGSKRLESLLTMQPIGEENEADADVDVLKACFLLGKVVTKSENNKVFLMGKGMAPTLVKVLKSPHALTEAWAEATTDACLMLRGLCLFDDLRKEQSCAYENGRAFMKEGAMAPLLTLAAAFDAFPNVASAAMAAAKQLVTSEEAVVLAAKCGAMALPSAILGNPESSLSLVRSLLGLTRNLCADDARKSKLTQDGTLPLLIAALNREALYNDAVLVEHGHACLAAMSLRSPANSERIAAAGGLEVLACGMRRHAEKVALQRQGCLCIRNISARCEGLRPQILDAGIEPLLRAAGRYQDSVDEAYGALRDLGCEVQRVRVDKDTGTVTTAFEEFGGYKAQGKPKRFNPIYDDRDDIVETVQENAKVTTPSRTHFSS